MENSCRMCGKIHDFKKEGSKTIYNCSSRKYIMDENTIMYGDIVEVERRLNAIYNFVQEKPTYKKHSLYDTDWEFYYDKTESVSEELQKINVYQLMKQYPYEVLDRIDKILINLSSKYPLLSDTFNLENLTENWFRLFYCESENRVMEMTSIFSALLRFDFIELAATTDNDDYKNEYRIAIDGWKRIAELRKNNEISHQGFIAMSFHESVKYIENAFIEAIRSAGFKAQIIKDKEHNNYIMPEIFHEIENSKFVVVDITRQNYGAYYEAGYAQALGKQVIVCCRKEDFENPETKPHFDIAQKSMILWENEEDLKQRLKNRILATVK